MVEEGVCVSVCVCLRAHTHLILQGLVVEDQSVRRENESRKCVGDPLGPTTAIVLAGYVQNLVR